MVECGIEYELAVNFMNLEACLAGLRVSLKAEVVDFS